MKGKDGPRSHAKSARRPQGGGKSRPAAAGPPPRGRYRGAGHQAARGPIACPMCGEVVANLSAHIRTRHDDPASHPRE